MASRELPIVGDLMHCPSMTTLRGLVAGSLSGDVADRLREHVEICEHCRGAMCRLEPTDGAAPPSGDPPETAHDPASSRTMTYGAPTLKSPLPTGCEDPPDLSFLAPTDRPDSLGRIAHYEILGILGSGGMGVVLKGFDPKLDRVVAIKLISPSLANSDRARRRFLREARSAAAIGHVNVVTIHSVDEEHGLPYLVMECLVGRSLKGRIEAGPKLDPREVLRIGMQIAEGLEAAHLHGVIHRDIKPANIMLLDRGGGVKITDFGLALVELDLAEMTSAGQVVGTPAYMSPEQVRGESVDPRSDLFSLGCVLFAMSAGRPPFQGRHILEIGRKITDEEPAPLHLLDPAVPRPLSDLVARLLRKAPEDRPATAGEVAAELRRLLDDPDLEIGTTVAARPAQKSVTKKSRAPRWAAAGAVLLLLLAALALARLVPSHRGTARRSGDAPAVPRGPAAGPVVLVGRGPEADFRTLPQALSFVSHTGTTIRLTEPGVYHGAARIEEPDRLRGLTIAGGPGVILTAPGSQNVVAKVADTANVTLRDLTILSGVEQFGLEVDGAAAGLELANVAFRKVDEDPGAEYWAHVWFAPGAHGTASAPIRFRGCTFGPWPTGVVLQGDSHRTIAHVAIEGCRFETRLRQLEIIRSAHDIRVAGNLFLSGRDALILDSLGSDLCRAITIANNSFYRAANWLVPTNASRGVEGVVIVNNALFEPGGLDTPGGDLAALAAGGWRFGGNLAEQEGPESPLAARHPRLDVLVRDPSDPRFLRPAAGSLLATSGLGGDWPSYAGARAPTPDRPAPADAPKPTAN